MGNAVRALCVLVLAVIAGLYLHASAPARPYLLEHRATLLANIAYSTRDGANRAGTLDASGVEDVAAAVVPASPDPCLIHNSPLPEMPASLVWTPEYVLENLRWISDIQETQGDPVFVYSHGPAAEHPLLGLPEVVAEHMPRVFSRTSASHEAAAVRLQNPPNNTHWVIAQGLSTSPALLRLGGQLGNVNTFTVKNATFDPAHAHRFRLTQLWVSGPGATSHAHVDDFYNMFLQIHGTKRFLLFPPEDMVRHMHMFPHLHPGAYQTQLDLERTLLNATHPRYPGARRARHAVDVTVHAGDVLYVPPLWGHHVISVTQSVSVSVWSPSEWMNPVNALIEQGIPIDYPMDHSRDARAAFARHVLHTVVDRVPGVAWAPLICELWQQRYAPLDAVLWRDRSDARAHWAPGALAGRLEHSGNPQHDIPIFPPSYVRDAVAVFARIQIPNVPDVRTLAVRRFYLSNWIETTLYNAVGLDNVVDLLAASALAADCQ